MSEKTMFDSAVEKAQTAFKLLEEAEKQFATLGIKVNSIGACGANVWGSPNNILLRSGINRASVLSEKEIESVGDGSYGKVQMDGFYFDQHKLPVEREDRYA